MKICEKCGNNFNGRVKIDGKIRNLNNRKFCLDCSPFGSHNTSNRCEKVCNGCNQIKSLDEFHANKYKGDKKQIYCKSCNNKFAKEDYKNKKDTVINRSKNRLFKTYKKNITR